MGQSIRTWIGATVVVAVLIAIAGWFLLISPTRAATADARANIASEESRTITLSADLKALKAQYANLDATRAALAAVSVQVPTKADDAAFRRVLADRAASSGVAVISLKTGAYVAVTPPAAKSGTSGSSTAPPSASPKPTASPGATASPSAAPSTASGAAPQTASGQLLVGIPLEMIVVGKYDAAKAFIASLQGIDGRLFLIYGLNFVSQPDATSAGGRPDTVKGDVELSIQGYLIVLTQGPDDAVMSAVPTPSPTPSPAPSAAPLPSTERNPFAPIASPHP
jgi:hypothetical protein